MTNRQWQEVEAIVRKEQVQSFLDKQRYDELSLILDELYVWAHEGESKHITCCDRTTKHEKLVLEYNHGVK